MFDIFDIFKDNQTDNSKASQQRYDGWSLEARDPQAIKTFLPVWEWLYNCYFRVTTDGWHHIPPQGKILLVGSHNGGLAAPDMFMCMYDWYRRFGTERLTYGLMHPTVWKLSPPIITQWAAQCGGVMAHPKMAIAGLEKDATVLVYPGGAQDVFRPHHLRHKICFAGRKGFIKLALKAQAPIIPIISEGAHDTLIVLADFYEQLKQLHQQGMPWLFGIDPVVFPIYLGLPWGLGIGPIPDFPLPAKIHTRICKPIIFERGGREAASDRAYVDACYQQVEEQMQLELDHLVQDVKNNTRQS